MTEYAIEAIGLSKKFLMAAERRTSLKERFVRGRAPSPKTFWALKDATFSVPKGSSLGVIGHNGSGKSTALKVLTGIYRPTSGTVKVNGSVSALLEVGAGFHPELTGRENVRLNATILGFTNREIDRFMDQIIEFADIGEHIDAPLKHYSSGMHVRLGFAVAVMVRPEILIVDEVIAVGDEEFQRKCYDYLYELRRAGTSMIIVSHGLSQITDLCDDAVWLSHGEVSDMGPAHQVVRHYLEDVNEREGERALQVLQAEPTDSSSALQSDGGSEDHEPDGESTDVAGDAPAPMRDGPDSRHPSGESVPLRRGSGEARISRVEMLDDAEARLGLLLTGRPATVRIHFEASEPLDGVLFGLGFDDERDRTVTAFNNRHLDRWEISAGAGFVDFRMEPVLLAGGRYQIIAEIHTSKRVVDALPRGAYVAVREPEVDMAGVYLQPGTWRLSQGAAVVESKITGVKNG